MPGRLRSSFRSGNLAEHLGLLLLKGIAAVAEVARPEDIGLDAIATLLRRDDDGNCYAEDSFVVQLKSDSATSIQYQDHELDWLVGQSQPMFIGRVSLADSQISLYPTLFVNQAALSLHARRVTVRFGTSGLPPFLAGQKWSPWRGEPDHSAATVWLGEPVLTWTLSDLVDESWAARAYQTLKRFIRLARRELELVSLGQCSVIDWATNDPSTITSQPGIMKGHLDDLRSLADRCAPCLHAIMLCAISMPNEPGKSLVIALMALAAALRDIGVEIDPDNLFGKFSFSLRSQPDTDDPPCAT
jgi:hypothetical protein